MKVVRRFDRYELTGKAQTTPQGFLRAPAFATRVGVLKYRNRDGSVLRELRLPEEVFNENSMDTLRNVPVTNEHPTDLLRTDNVTSHMVGLTGESVEKVDDKFLKVWTTIVDAKTIEDIGKGKSEVSCGYVCDLEEAPGVWNGEPYDLIQRNIRYNHLAIVPRGRAGREVRLKLDSDDAILTEGKDVMKIMLGGKEWEVADDLAAAIQAEMDAMKMDAQKAKDALNVAPKQEQMDEMKNKLDQTQAKADALDAEVTKLKAQPPVAKMDAEAVSAEGKLFARALLLAKKLGVEKADEMNDRVEIMKAVIKADSADADLTDKSVHYVEARFDAIAERDAKNDAAATSVGRSVTTPKTEKADSENARERYLNKLYGKEAK